MNAKQHSWVYNDVKVLSHQWGAQSSIQCWHSTHDSFVSSNLTLLPTGQVCHFGTFIPEPIHILLGVDDSPSKFNILTKISIGFMPHDCITRVLWIHDDTVLPHKALQSFCFHLGSSLPVTADYQVKFLLLKTGRRVGETDRYTKQYLITLSFLY